MQMKENIDNGKQFDWGLTSKDYLLYRPGYPENFFSLLQMLGIGLRGQEILDIGTGTGALAIPFNRQGSNVTALDISEEQISAARSLADKEKLNIKFVVSSAESTMLPDHSFDALTASMCWMYFDKEKIIPEVIRLLRKDGLLMVSSLIWLPLEDNIAQKTEELILKYNPDWKGGGFTDNVNPVPNWSKEKFSLKSFHKYKENIPFNYESWRGRIRASRGIGASLAKDKIEKFDNEHQKLLEKITPENFNIRHLIQFYIFEIKQVNHNNK